MNSKTKTLVTASLLAALTVISTMIIKIPSPLKGYMNLGDCVVLLSGWILPPFYSFFAAGLGSALADLFLGYTIYAPATFIIKGLMAICAHYVYKATNQRIISGFLAECIMVFGYYIFEGVLYGFIPSLANMPANIVQGVAGLVLGLLLIKTFEKLKIN